MAGQGAGRHEVSIERVVPGGEGLGRVGSVVALVAGVLPGDRVAADLSPEGKRLLRGRAVEILSPGPHRREESEICPRASDGTCGGCDWPAARRDSAATLKTEIVLDALRRVGRFERADVPSPRFVSSPPNYRLRNRFHRDADGRLGFFAPRSNRVAADLSTCEIVSKPLLSRLPAIRESLRSLGSAEGELSTLEDREGKTLLGEFRLGPGSRLENPSSLVKGAFDGLRLLDPDGRVRSEDGPSALDLVAGGATFRVSVSSFFQGNRFLLDVFLEEIREALPVARPFRALDLYAGAGFLTRPLLEIAVGAEGSVTAVEVNGSSSRDLSENLQRWEKEGFRGARSFRATAEAFLASKALPGSVDSFDVVVADPPRAGLSPHVRRALARMRPRTLLMVSCDPPTLARDLGAIREAYGIERLTLLDLFPGTHHIETVALLSRRT
ncbi:MAG: class I SAM-dependent RNA methyltransferase [Thermoanaerobaculia bacterium]